MKNNILTYILLFMIILTFDSITFAIDQDNYPKGHLEGKVTEVYDQNDKYIFSTSKGITPGDKYISQENIEYIIKKIKNNKAIAEKRGEIKLLSESKEVIDAFNFAAKKSKTIALYHTHNGESYQPGAENIEGPGDIHEIGRTLKNQLEKHGIHVIHSENMHLPHDGAAYERSRATAIEIAGKRPDAIFDLHRDAIPRREEYLTRLNGKTISQIRIVVGRQNPNYKANDQFARTLKAVSDDLYPGLIRDIFYGGGSYNQQVSSHSLLLEFGSHVTGKNKAKTSTEMMASTVNQLLYGQSQELAKSSEKREKTYTLTTLVWVLTLFIIALFVYLYIDEGNLSGVIKRVKNYFHREIIDRGNK